MSHYQFFSSKKIHCDSFFTQLFNSLPKYFCSPVLEIIDHHTHTADLDTTE